MSYKSKRTEPGRTWLTPRSYLRNALRLTDQIVFGYCCCCYFCPSTCSMDSPPSFSLFMSSLCFSFFKGLELPPAYYRKPKGSFHNLQGFLGCCMIVICPLQPLSSLHRVPQAQHSSLVFLFVCLFGGFPPPHVTTSTDCYR